MEELRRGLAVEADMMVVETRTNFAIVHFANSNPARKGGIPSVAYGAWRTVGPTGYILVNIFNEGTAVGEI